VTQTRVATFTGVHALYAEIPDGYHLRAVTRQLDGIDTTAVAIDTALFFNSQVIPHRNDTAEKMDAGERLWDRVLNGELIIPSQLVVRQLSIASPMELTLLATSGGAGVCGASTGTDPAQPAGGRVVAPASTSWLANEHAGCREGEAGSSRG
jgi:hypothetical protein